MLTLRRQLLLQQRVAAHQLRLLLGLGLGGLLRRPPRRLLGTLSLDAFQLRQELRLVVILRGQQGERGKGGWHRKLLFAVSGQAWGAVALPFALWLAQQDRRVVVQRGPCRQVAVLAPLRPGWQNPAPACRQFSSRLQSPVPLHRCARWRAQPSPGPAHVVLIAVVAVVCIVVLIVRVRSLGDQRALYAAAPAASWRRR